VLDLRDAALVYSEFACNFAIAPVEIEEERNDLLLSRRKALPGALKVHPVREGVRGATRAPGLKRRKLLGGGSMSASDSKARENFRKPIGTRRPAAWRTP
jgi:hypothetical protein